MMDPFTTPDQQQLGEGDYAPPQSQRTGSGGGGGSIEFDSFDKTQVDFDTSDFAVMEGILKGNNNDGDDDEFNKLFLAKETADTIDDDDVVGDLDLDQLNFDLARLQPGDGNGSESSMDKLMSMKIIDVEDGDGNIHEKAAVAVEEGHNSDLMREFAKGFLAQTEETSALQDGNDLLLGRMSAGVEADVFEQQRQQLQQQRQILLEQQQQQYELQQQIEQQTQLMQMQAMIQQQQEQQRMLQEQQEAEEGLTAAKVSHLASMGSADLEMEKMKLLMRLQEINSRHTNSMGMMQQPSPAQIRSSSSGVASVMNNSNHSSGSSETPLSAFLRNKNKGGAAVPSQASVLSRNVPGAPVAANILDASPMDVGGSANPFFRQAVAGGTNPLVGAMNKSSSSQNMIRHTLSGRNLHAPGGNVNRLSGPHLMEMMASDLQGGGGNQNAAWGTSGLSSQRRSGVSSFSASGILARHVSDGHLMAGATTVSASLAKTKNRVGSLSRENALYSMLKNKQGSRNGLNGLARQSSQSRLTKSSSKGSFSRNDSFGSSLPAKRGYGRTNSKYKIGASTSVPHLMVRGRTSPSSSNDHGGNAIW